MSAPVAPVTAPRPPEASAGKIYRVGTLTYTRSALATVLFWMLLGDWCLQIVEAVPSLIPLLLKWSGATDSIIGLLTASGPYFLSVILYPIVGVWSDRHRGKLGRRRPFLLWFTPVIVVALALTGYAPDLAKAIGPRLGISSPWFAIALIGLFNLLFAVSNTVILQVYQFLFVDVIPQEVMGKFIGFYRAIGALGTFAFHRWGFGHAETYAGRIFTGSGVLYAIAFLLLVWRVKEGTYPPPEAAKERKTLLQWIKTYFRECFGSSFHLKAYLLTFCYWNASVPYNTFLVFFCTKAGREGYAPTLELPLAEYGQLRSWLSLAQVPVFFLVGPFIDRFHPLRVVIVSYVIMAITYWSSIVMVTSARTYLIWGLANIVGVSIFTACQLVIFPRILPKEKYGQFFTANQVIGISGLLVTPVICGRLLDVFHNYRLIFAWAGTFTLIGFFAAIALYRHWLRLGGDKDFDPKKVGREFERVP